MAGSPHDPYFLWKLLRCQTQVACVKFSHDGNLIAVGDNDGNLSLWNTDTGLKIKSDQPNHPLPIYDIVWSRDSSLILMGHYLGRYTLWDVARGRTLRSELIGEDFIATVDMDSRGTLGLLGGETNLTLIDNRTLNVISTKHAHDCTGAFITASRFSPDGTKILSSGLNDDFKMWDKGSFRRLNLPYPDTPVLRAIFFPQGKEILVTYADNTFQVFETHRLRLIGNGMGVSSLSYANAAVDSGPSLLIGGDDGRVDVVSKYGTSQKLQHHNHVEIIECSKRKNLAACVPSDEKCVFLWKYPTSQ